MSTVSTGPFFSNDYYSSRSMFSELSLYSSDPKTYKRSFSSTLLPFRKTHAIVDNNGTIATVPFSLFNDLQRYFKLTQDPNLIAVHRRLKNLEVHIQNPQSPVLQALQKEVHDKGRKGNNDLYMNLYDLYVIFNRANHKNLFTLTLVKMTNLVRKLLYLQPIEYYLFEPINFNLFDHRALRPALEITPEDQRRSHFFTVIQNNSSFPLDTELLQENLLRLEYGFLNDFSINIDQKHLTISYNKTKKEFVISHDREVLMPHPTAYTLYNQKKNYSYRSNPINIVEKKLDGSETDRPLQYSVEYTHQDSPWYRSVDKLIRVFNPGKVAMTANNEYTIPLSQGNLCIKLYRRVQF